MKRSNWFRRLAIAWLGGLLLVAVFGDFLANDRPLIAKIEGELRFPVLHQYGEDLGLVEGYQPTVRNWYRLQPDWALWPPIPYIAGASDVKNGNYRSPFAEQNTGERARHYLGTDKLGRDVFAGLIAGARVSVIVGIGALLISLLLGIPLGGVAGFFGNNALSGTRAFWWGWSVGGSLGILYAAINLLPFFRLTGFFSTALLLLFGFIAGGLLLVGLLRLFPPMRKAMNFPADTFVLQGVELFVNIPGLVLLIALLAIINRPSIWLVALIIGVLRWTYVARYLRAEMLRIRSLPYIDAARISGIGRWRILFRHALPNALGPIIVVSCFGLGGAILLEAFLSFLGIGIPANQVTWGSLLGQSRSHPSAWWMALFPGMLLTLTVLAANLLGERE
ncbi:ABC transporter permease [Neolewinella persica]|uniref:ABC transporter permease n=1 Tax=Neolewinella persica TaxID=70998 RepID=UPI0003605643|nr:ABC transporter permease [Neolewinella persica]